MARLARPPSFARPEHLAVIGALQRANAKTLADAGCLFGGGTAIVLAVGEYRVSKDIDFLCSTEAGYRDLRSRVARDGLGALFGPGVEQQREFRFDRYGMRTMISHAGIPLRLEIVREGRIRLDDGVQHPSAPVATLGPVDRAAEKLLANADRGQDRSSAYRDAIDLGMVTAHRGPIPDAALVKAERAYGDDVGRKAFWAVERLRDAGERQHAATALGMAPEHVEQAAGSLHAQVRRLWPALDMARPRRSSDRDVGM